MTRLIMFAALAAAWVWLSASPPHCADLRGPEACTTAGEPR